jgi:lipopolysaccharide/colanic/teichoic acid biosynthesis glycosyltransferase
MPRGKEAMKLSPVKSASNPDGSPFEPLSAGEHEVLSESSFRRMIAIERKRTERSSEPFLLMLLEAGTGRSAEMTTATLNNMASALLASSRGTDIVGWYKGRSIVGVIFTGLVVHDKNAVLSTILSRVKATLRGALVFDQLNQVSISFHFFPDEWNHEKHGNPINMVLYPDLLSSGIKRRIMLFVKRLIDILGSALALVLLSPLFWLIAIAIKVSSKGPVFFSQTRIGQFGKPFILMKFRTMYTNIDRGVHKQYVTELIADKSKRQSPSPDGVQVYKLTNDTRITRIGKFLRRTSLDELPQFFNVLRGEMSLVGPRPAVRYEVAVYETWHRRRVLEFKPGITGLWQVSGRSHVKFDEMVRLDLRYARSWSPWLDLKILMLTPLAVLRGTGAY